MRPDIEYPPIGSLVHIELGTELISLCPDRGCVAAVVDDKTYGIIIAHNTKSQQISVEVAIDNQSWWVTHQFIRRESIGWWPLKIISKLENEGTYVS